MLSGADRDIRELIKALRENTAAVKSLEKTLKNSQISPEQKQAAFENYMLTSETEIKRVPTAAKHLIPGICGDCFMSACQRGTIEKNHQGCTCCAKNHVR